MDAKRKAKLEADGWKLGTAEEFLGLTVEESAMVEVRLRLARRLRELRTDRGLSQVEAARLLGSSQSRVAKMEAGGSGVTVDLILRSLFRLGATPRDVSRAVGG